MGTNSLAGQRHRLAWHPGSSLGVREVCRSKPRGTVHLLQISVHNTIILFGVESTMWFACIGWNVLLQYWHWSRFTFVWVLSCLVLLLVLDRKKLLLQSLWFLSLVWILYFTCSLSSLWYPFMCSLFSHWCDSFHVSSRDAALRNICHRIDIGMVSLWYESFRV